MAREGRLPVTLVLLAAALLYLPGLGATDLWAPDEPRYAQVAEELRTGAGHRVLLHLNGEPYTQKPPLYFWLAALAGAAADRVSAQAAPERVERPLPEPEPRGHASPPDAPV